MICVSNQSLFKFQVCKMLSSVAIASCLLLAGTDCVNAVQDDGPSKDKLIATLSGLLESIEQRDFEAAAKFVVIPAGMDPAELASLPKKRELSKDGIAHLAAKAEFGKAAEMFEAERADYFASKMKVSVGECFAFNHSFEGVTAEAIGVWVPADAGSAATGHFKLIRVDDIGKLPAIATRATNAPENPVGSKPTSVSNNAQPIPDLSALRYPLAQTPPPANMAEIAMKMVELEKTVKAKPDDPTVLANYAQSLYLIRSYPKAWEQLMTASNLDPKHDGVRKGIDAVVDSMTLLGAFTVGMPKESVVNLLGDPRKVIPTKIGDRLVYAHWVVQLKGNQVHEIIDLRGATLELFTPKEIVDVLFEREWRTAFRKKQGTRVLAVMYTDDQIMNNASEQITVERLLGGGTVSIKDIVAKLQNDGKKGLKTRYKVLQTDDGSAIIAATAQASDGQPARHSLVKIMKGEQDLHRLTYTVLSDKEPTRETQMKWLGFFQKAKLLPAK